MNGNIRKEYGKELSVLDPETIEKDPFILFNAWYARAIKEVPDEPNAIALATATKDSVPSVRMVLLKGVDSRGFVFFTNYQSRKAKELLENPRAAICLYWSDLERQIRIEGVVERVSDQESDRYFAMRPRGAQLGAHASKQSHEISSSELRTRFEEVKKKFEGSDVSRPDDWGGFRLVPAVFEFWQGQENRLHDRIIYSLEGGVWKIKRLSP